MLEAAPPPAVGGGGKWEATHGAMAGYCEIRVTGPGPPALPSLLPARQRGTERELVERGFDRPQIAVINGKVKQHMTEFSDGDYGERSDTHAERAR